WSGDGLDEVPPAERAGAMAFDGALFRADQGSHGVAHHRPHLGEERANVRCEVARLSRARLEGLDRVGHARARDLPHRVGLLRRERHGDGAGRVGGWWSKSLGLMSLAQLIGAPGRGWRGRALGRAVSPREAEWRSERAVTD